MILKYYITVLIIALTVPSIKGQSYICDDTPENNNGVCECSADVCYFKFVIEHLQTFTAYEKNATMGSPGRVYYLDNHNLKPATKNRMVCEDLSECTETHTVDGSTYRSFFAINKRIPGPTLIVNNGVSGLRTAYPYNMCQSLRRNPNKKRYYFSPHVPSIASVC